MNKDELIAALAAPVNSQRIANSTLIVESNNIDLRDVFELSFHKKKEVAFRAAWMLEYYMVNKPEVFEPHLKLLFELLPKVKNESAMRHYAKMMSLLTDRKVHTVYKDGLSLLDFEPVVEALFTWLVDEEVLVATKVHCMQMLANVSGRFDWIKEELLQTINHLEEMESVAFFARAKVVKKTLNKQSAKR